MELTRAEERHDRRAACCCVSADSGIGWSLLLTRSLQEDRVYCVHLHQHFVSFPSALKINLQLRPVGISVDESDDAAASQTKHHDDNSDLRAHATMLKNVSGHLTLPSPKAPRASRHELSVATSRNRESEDGDAQSRRDGRVQHYS